MVRSIQKSIAAASTTSDDASHDDDDYEDFTAPPSQPSVMDSSKTDDDLILHQFQSSASRILSLYATNRGSDAISISCTPPHVTTTQTNFEPNTPRDSIGEALHIVKRTCLECASVFGGNSTASPPPKSSVSFLEGDGGGVVTSYGFAGSNRGPGGGLQADVERMFADMKDTEPIYNPFIQFNRSAVVTGVFQMLFRALLEHTRSSFLSKWDQLQVQMDVELFRTVIPHYVDSVEQGNGDSGHSTLFRMLDDVLLTASERCIEGSSSSYEDGMEDDDGQGLSSAYVQTFLETNWELCERFMITENE